MSLNNPKLSILLKEYPEIDSTLVESIFLEHADGDLSYAREFLNVLR
jgi:hypothetical protein